MTMRVLNKVKGMELKMKKVVILLLFVMFTVGCSSNRIDKISYSELSRKLENEESFILYFDGEDDDVLEGSLNDVLEEYNLEAYKFDPSKLSEEDLEKFKLEIDYETPSIVFIINGSDPTKLSHVTGIYTRKEEIVRRLIDMGFVTSE